VRESPRIAGLAAGVGPKLVPEVSEPARGDAPIGGKACVPVFCPLRGSGRPAAPKMGAGDWDGGLGERPILGKGAGG
jgi:hypothetical protein